MKNQYRSFVFLLLASLPCFAKVTHDEQFWLNLNGTTSLTESVKLYLEYQPRVIQNREYLGTTLYRAALGTDITKGLSFWAGYGFVDNTAPTDFQEDRPFFQLLHSSSWDQFRLINRTRLEIRHFRGEEAESYRPRHLVRGLYRLTEGLSLVISNEWFWNANSITPAPSTHVAPISEGFEQNRIFFGLAHHFGQDRRQLIEAGYMNQYVNGVSRDRSNHILATQVALQF